MLNNSRWLDRQACLCAAGCRIGNAGLSHRLSVEFQTLTQPELEHFTRPFQEKGQIQRRRANVTAARAEALDVLVKCGA
jgi:hypothetical protein